MGDIIPGLFETSEGDDKSVIIHTTSDLSTKLSKSKMYKALFAICFMDKLDDTYIQELYRRRQNVDAVEISGSITLTKKNESTRCIELKPMVLYITHDDSKR